jgi:hypothetical protein
MLDSRLAYSLILKIEATCCSETSVGFQRNTRRYIPEHRTRIRQFVDSNLGRDISLNLAFVWVSSVSPGKWWNGASMWPQPPSSKSIPVHFHLPFDAMYRVRYWQPLKINNRIRFQRNKATSHNDYKTKTNSVALVRKRTIPTERPPLAGEVFF